MTSPNQNSTWCPGCSNFLVLQVLKDTLQTLKIPPHQLAIICGIGCSGNINSHLKAYVYHSLHGRTIPTAIGVKLANPKLKVIAIGGDGDILAEGLSHLIHAGRFNHDITTIILNNQLYSLTTGQASPTTPIGNQTISTPQGNSPHPLDPVTLSLSSNASHICRTFANDLSHLKKILTSALAHPGFSVVEVLQPCLSLNKVNTSSWFKERIKYLKKTPQSLSTAIQKAIWTDKTIYLGEFRKIKKSPYHQQIKQKKTTSSTSSYTTLLQS